MLTDLEQYGGAPVADALFTTERDRLTTLLTRAMAEEQVLRDNHNMALSTLRRAAARTKQAAEALGQHAQKHLAL